MLKKFFIDSLNNKKFFLSKIKEGKDFKKKVEDYLINSRGIKKIGKQHIHNFTELKQIITNKLDDNAYIPNNKWVNLQGYFISQPFGSQSYPDFLIFTNDKIIPLEIKMSSNKDKIMFDIH